MGYGKSFKKRLSSWVYQNDLELINSPTRRNQDFFIIQVILANAFAILTGGEFLSGLPSIWELPTIWWAIYL